MIIVKLRGGLGNQMFQYAIGKKLSIIKGTELKLDLRHYIYEQTEERTIRDYELDVFNLNVEIAETQDILMVRGQNKNILFRKAFNFIERYKKYYNRQTVNEKTKDFDKNILKVNKNCYLSGFWQSEKYFKDIRNVLLKDFSFSDEADIDYRNKAILDQIRKTNSIAIHIRKGDYVTNPHYRNVHINLNTNYYLQAIDLIKSKTVKPKFFFFSDDIDFVKKEFAGIQNATFIDNNTQKGYMDMFLMSNCKHNIIANSSFSWWSAWLNKNIKKMVVSPERWYKLSNFNSDDLIPDSWIKLCSKARN